MTEADRVNENPTTPERIAANDAAFRHANEGISETAEEYELTEGLLPFTQLTRQEYEEIRSNPAWFMNVPGHEVAAREYGRVRKTNDRYVIVEKIGTAGEIARELDPRVAEAEERDGVA